MNWPWDCEVRSALRVAAALFEPPRVAGLGTAPTSLPADPSATMDRLFGRLLSAGTAPLGDPDPAPIAPIQGRTRGTALPPAAPPRLQYPTGAALSAEAWIATAIAAPRLGVGDDRSDPFADRAFRPPAARPSGRTGLPPPETHGTHGTQADPINPPQARFGTPAAGSDASHPPPPMPRPSIPQADHHGPSAAPRGPVPDLAAATGPDAMHPYRHGADPAAEPALVEAPPGATHPGAPPDARGMRLVTGLADLRGLLNSAVADSQSRDHPVSYQAPAAFARVPTQGAVASGQDPGQPPAAPVTRGADLPGPSQPEQEDWGRETRRLPEAPHLIARPSPQGSVTRQDQAAQRSGCDTVSATPDPLWEDLLLERLLDRWEERRREDAIRHLGFTGGLT